jgi:hypothetical protein
MAKAASASGAGRRPSCLIAQEPVAVSSRKTLLCPPHPSAAGSKAIVHVAQREGQRDLFGQAHAQSLPGEGLVSGARHVTPRPAPGSAQSSGSASRARAP